MLKAVSKINLDLKDFEIVILGNTGGLKEIKRNYKYNFRTFDKNKPITDFELIKTAYSACDLLIMPSRLEALGQVALEAGSCSLPCVSFKNTGIEDIITHNEDGYLAEYLNVEEELVFLPDMKLGDGYDPVVLNTTQQPVENSISAAYPNPFNPVVNFDIDLDGNHYVDARVYNIAGQEVSVLHDGLLSGSAQTLSWMATNQSSGIYFIRIVVDGMTTVNNKVILLK